MLTLTINNFSCELKDFSVSIGYNDFSEEEKTENTLVERLDCNLDSSLSVENLMADLLSNFNTVIEITSQNGLLYTFSNFNFDNINLYVDNASERKSLIFTKYLSI